MRSIHGFTPATSTGGSATSSRPGDHCGFMNVRLVEAPVEVERGVSAEGGEAGAHRPHVFLEARSRRVEGDAVTPLRMGADLGAEPEAEASAGRVRQLPRAFAR